jgi:hypothetical protein
LRKHGELDTVEVGLAAEELADRAKPSCTHGSLALTVELVVDVHDLRSDIGVVLGQLAKNGEVLKSLLMATDLDQPTGALFGKPREKEDDASEHEVHAVGDEPLGVGFGGDVDGRTPGCKVGKHNTKVHGARECTNAETSDGPRRRLSKIGGSNDSRLADSDTSNESSGIDLADGSSQGAGEEDGDANDPDETELACSPKATNLVSDEEGDQGAEDRSHLHHGGDVGQELCLVVLALAGVVEAKLSNKGFEFGRGADQAFVDTTGSAHDAKDCALVSRKTSNAETASSSYQRRHTRDAS